MEDGLFTPPPGQVRASNVPSHKQLSKVTALIKKEMSFIVRPKKHAGLETILDATKVDVGHIHLIIVENCRTLTWEKCSKLSTTMHSILTIQFILTVGRN